MNSEQLKQLQQQLRTAIKELGKPEQDAIYQQLVDADVKLSQAVRGLTSREREKVDN